MPIQVMNTLELVSHQTTWFFYGRTRTGKTTAISTFPAPLILQPMNEDSIDTLQGLNVDYIPLRPTRQGKTGDTMIMTVMDEALSYLENKALDAKKHWDKGTEEGDEAGNAIFPWMTIAFESISHYTDMLQEELTRHALLDMDQQKWGKLSAHMRSIHERMKSLPVHVIYVSLVAEKYDQKGKLISGEPVFPGQMSMKLPSACGGVIYFDRASGNPNDVYTAHFTRTEVYNAGVRYPKLRSIKIQRPFNFAEISKMLGLSQ